MVQCRNRHANTGANIDFDARLPMQKSNEEINLSSVILRISLKDATGDLIKYGLATSKEQLSRQEYYSLNFTNDIYLLAGTDTFPCIDSHMEQLYMDLPYRTFILYFGDHVVGVNDKILIMDKVFSNKVVLVSINKRL